MRWFISWYVTALVTGFAAALLVTLDWLSNKEQSWATAAREAIALEPNGSGGWLLILAAQLACWILVRLVLVRVFAYINSELSSSPRGDDSGSLVNRRRASRGRVMIRMFHNPTGWWLAPYALVLNLIVWSARPFEWTTNPPIPVAAWGLCALFGATLLAAMVTPDKRIPVRFRGAQEGNLDRLLETPEDQPGEESPVLGAA